MATAESNLGISNSNIQGDLTAFYNDAEAAILKHRPDLAGDVKFGGNLRLDVLPFDVRTQLIGRYRQIIRFDEAINSLDFGGADPRVPDVMDKAAASRRRARGVTSEHKTSVSRIYHKLTRSSPSGKSPFGRIPGNMSGSVLSDIYSRLNVQFRSRLMLDRAGIVHENAATAASYFHIGLNSIPSRHSLDRPSYTPGMLKGKSRLVYDIETAGLAKGQIREVAFSRIDTNGVLSINQPLLFTPKEFERGLIAVDGRAASLREFMGAKFGMKMPKSTSGDEFAEGMIPFLKQVLDSDYIVGHNISGFDNQHVFVGLSKTTKYANDKTFRSLVDSAFEHVTKNTIDTLDIVRQMEGIGGISTAGDLARTGDRSLFSISNLLLQTDLVDRMGGVGALAELMGYKDGEFALGLHHAGVDTAVTNAIIEAAESGGLQLKRLGAGLRGKDSTLAKLIRSQIVDSSAITPQTFLSDASQLTDKTLKYLIENYQRDSGPLRATGELHEMLQRGDHQAAFRAIREKRLKPSSIRLSAVEQKILSERNIGRGLDIGRTETASIVSRIGKIAPRKGLSALAERRAARTAGLPFAGLSREERVFGYGISRATASLSSLSGTERTVAAIAGDTLVSRFDMFGADTVQYSARSGRVSLPSSMVEKLGVLKQGDLLTMSVVEGTADSPSSAINLVQNLTRSRANTLANRIEKLMQADDETIKQTLGGSADDVARLREAVDDGLLDNIRKNRSVAVGQIYGSGKNEGVVSRIKSTLSKYLNIEGQIQDRDSFRMALPYMETEGTHIRTAGAVFRESLSKSEASNLGKAVEATKAVYKQYRAMPKEDKKAFRIAQYMTDKGMSEEVAQRMYVLMHEKLIPNLGKGLAGVAAIGVGALLLRKYQNDQKIDETFKFQGWESGAQGTYGIHDQIQQRIDAGYDGYANHIDPLATASLTDILNGSSTGNYNMSWDRSNELYGGML